MGAEGREGVTWRSGCAFQAALSKALGLRRVAFSRAEKAACVAGIEMGGERDGGTAGGAWGGVSTALLGRRRGLEDGRGYGGGHNGCAALPEATDLFFFF